MPLDPLPVLKGTLDVLVLKALTWQPMHGFEITSWLERQSGHRLALDHLEADVPQNGPVAQGAGQVPDVENGRHAADLL